MTHSFGVSLASVTLRPIFATSINPGPVMIALVVAVLVLAGAALLYFSRKPTHPEHQPQTRIQPVKTTRPLKVTAAGGTHIGGRSNNEDAYLLKGNLLVIADGMGGQAAGEVASKAVVDTFEQIDAGRDTWLADGILTSNATMRTMAAADPDLKGFGTTVVAARHTADEMELGSCGDSHFFRLRGGVLEKLTVEHSLAMELFKRGNITEAEVATHQFRNVLVRRVGGTSDDPEWDTLKFRMLRGDIYLICSDGLVDYSQLARVQQLLESGKSAQEIVDDLLANAVADDTRDNATAIVVLVS